MKHLLLLLGICLLLAPAARSADFTITVPVDLGKIPVDYTTLQVKCWAVCSGDATSSAYGNPISMARSSSTDGPNQPGQKLELIAYQLYNNWDVAHQEMPGYVATVGVANENVQIVGAGRTDRPIPPATGEFHQSVEVSFDAFATEGYAPDNVHSYVCGMKISKGNDIWAPHTYELGNDLSSISALSQPENPVGSSGGFIPQPPVFVSVGEFYNPAIDPNQEVPDCRRRE